MWCVYTVEYYPTVKKNEIMCNASKVMDLEKILVSGIVQTQKDKYNMSTGSLSALVPSSMSSDVSIQHKDTIEAREE